MLPLNLLKFSMSFLSRNLLKFFHVFSFQKLSQIFYVFSFQKSVEKSPSPCYNIPICLGLAHASRWMNFKSWSSLAAMTRDCKSLGLHLRRFESYLQHQSCLCMTRRLSSVVEHFHGKEGVSSSNLEGGSMKRNKKEEFEELYFYF